MNMDQLMTLYAWFTILLIVVVIVMDVFLAFKFKRYYQASGFGIVTCILLSLVCVQVVTALVYGATSIIIIISDGQSKFYINLLKEAGISWLTASTLLHTVTITLLRIYSVSYGNKFLKFIRSKCNIILVILNLWFVSLTLTIVTILSATTTTYTVFNIGLFVTGVFAAISFFVTIDTSLNIGKSVITSSRELRNPIGANSKRRNDFKVVRNPRKTFTLFSGIIVSFIVFSLPTSIPNLYFTLRGKLLNQSTSLIISLWLLVGVVFNSLWILMRLRSRVNDTEGFYGNWTKHGVSVHYHNRNININNNKIPDDYGRSRYFVHTELLDEHDTAPETETEAL